MPAYRESAAYRWTSDSVRIIAAPSQTAKALFYYVQEIGHFRALDGYYTERENLDSYLIVHTLSGAGRLHYGGQAHEVRAGQAFFIDCMQYQHYEKASAEPWEMLWVHFNGSASRGYYGQFAKRGNPVLELAPASAAAAAELLGALVRTHAQMSFRAEATGSSLLTQLLTLLLLEGREPAGSGDEAAPDYVERMIKELDRRYVGKISVDELAAALAVNKFKLAKAFKRYTGYSPHEYVINLRMTSAKELLRYSQEPVAAIAAQVGIDNVSHFINLFKAREQLTPLAYRRKWQYSRE